MRDLFIILGAEFTSTKNSILKTDKKNSRKFLQTLIIVALMAWLLFFLCGQVENLFSWLNSVLSDYPELLNAAQLNVLSALTLGVFIMLLVTGFTSIYNTLYNSGDLNFLMGTPLSTTSVFAGKLIKALTSNFVSVLPFVLPIWIGFGLAYKASFGYYIMVFLTVLSQVAIFTCLVAILIMLIMRLTESSKMKQIVKIAPLLLGVIFVVAVQLISAFMSSEPAVGDIAMSISSWGLGSSNLLPHIWIVKSNLSMLPSYDFSLLGSFLPLLLLTVGIAGLTFLVANKMFLRGWTLSKEVGGAKKAHASSSALLKKKSVFYRGRSQNSSLVYKDWLVWKRQPLMWYGVLVGLIGMVFFIFNMSKIGHVTEIPLLFENLMLFICIMFGSLSSGGLSIFSVSMDGESLWLLKSSPISPMRYYISKLIVTIIPGVIVSLIGLIGLKIYPVMPTYQLYISLPAIIVALIAIESIQITTDVLKPNFDIRMSATDSNRKMNDPVKSLILMISSMFGAALLVGAFALPMYGNAISFLANMSQRGLMIIGFALFLLIAAVCALLSGRISVGRIKNIFRGEN